MHDKLDISNLVLAAVFSALGIILPMIFHLLGLGSVFLPMYIPLAAGAYFLNYKNAVIMGTATPLISALLTGMPPFYPPIAFAMMVQLGTVCLVISILSHRAGARVITALAAALIADRILLAAFYFLVIPFFGIHAGLYTAYDLIKSLPGIVLMFVVIPLAVPGLGQVIQQRALRLYERGEAEGNEHEHH